MRVSSRPTLTFFASDIEVSRLRQPKQHISRATNFETPADYQILDLLRSWKVGGERRRQP